MAVSAAAFLAAQRFLSAATIAAFPALLSFRFAFGGSGMAGAGGSDSPRILAHRRCWASFMHLLAAAENFLRFHFVGSGVRSQRGHRAEAHGVRQSDRQSGAFAIQSLRWRR